MNIDQNLDPCKNYVSQIVKLDKFINQRKLFNESSKFLGVEKAGSMFHSLNMIDINYWKSLQHKGMNLRLLEQTCCLDRFNVNFDGKSMFHIFASKPEIIDMIAQKFRYEKLNQRISEKQMSLAL